MSTGWTDREIAAWLDEMLPAARLSELEDQLRDDIELQERIAEQIRQRDQGGHSVGEIWHRQRLSCPSRSELGGYLLGTLDAEQRDYLDFHMGAVGCRVCAANLEDLKAATAEANEQPARSRRYFESSAGLLRRSEDDQF